MRRYSVFALVFLLLAGTAYADQRPVFIEGIRALGMGGGGVALADDDSVQFYNPAGLILLEESKIVFPHFAGQFNHEMFSNVSYLSDKADAMDEFDINQAIVDDLTDMEFNAVFEFGMAYLDPGISVGVYTPLLFDLDLNESLFMPEAELYLGYDVITMFSHAAPLGESDASYGVNLKLVRRAYIYEDKNILQYADMEGDYINDRMTSGSWGAGLDVGFLLPSGEDKRYAVVVQDLFTRLKGDTYRPNVKIGAMWEMDWELFGVVKEPVVVLDVVDLIGDDDKIPIWHSSIKKWTKDDYRDSLSLYLKRTHLGLESSPLPYAKLRVGIGQGYPSLGTSLDIKSLHLGYALFGKEFGVYPGSNGRYFHKFSLVCMF